MKKLILGAVALSMFTSSAGFAQRYDGPRNDRDNDGRYNDGPRDRMWRRGERLPREYLDWRYTHNGWNDSGLRRPGRGQHWVIIGNQFLLINNGNGLVVDVAVVPRRGEGRGWGYSDNRDELWRNRYQRTYTYNDDVAYTQCNTNSDPAGVLAGALIGGLLGNAAAGRGGGRTGATVAGVIAGGAIGAALTSKLDCSDRSYAYKTYRDGFNGGRAGATYSWQNPQNRHRGEMKVIDYYNDEDRFRCAVFSQTVYIDGRREEARGRACQQPDGTWAIID